MTSQNISRICPRQKRRDNKCRRLPRMPTIEALHTLNGGDLQGSSHMVLLANYQLLSLFWGTAVRQRTPSSGLFMGSISTLMYTSELILCSTICVPSATRHNIHMYTYFLFFAIHLLNRPRLSLSDLVPQPAE